MWGPLEGLLLEGSVLGTIGDQLGSLHLGVCLESVESFSLTKSASNIGERVLFQSEY